MRTIKRLFLTVAAFTCLTPALYSAEVDLSYKDRLWSLSGTAKVTGDAAPTGVKVKATYKYYLRFRPAGEKVVDDSGILFEDSLKANEEFSHSEGPLTIKGKVTSITKNSITLMVKLTVGGTFRGRDVNFTVAEQTVKISI